MWNVLAWGAAEDGQLGLGGRDEPYISTPTRVASTEGMLVESMSAGDCHAMFLMNDRSVRTCGNNDHGQLGQDVSTRKPESVAIFENQPAVSVEAGKSHSVVITAAGEVFTWGDNSEGQLGLGTADMVPHNTPKLVKTLASKVVIQVACGNQHTLALTNESIIYSWGSNSHGQLGRGPKLAKTYIPEVIASISSLPVRQIIAGGNHTFVLTRSGALFGWGKNSYGQLGRNDVQDQYHPILCKALRNQKVKYVACGEDHTVALTEDGGVFTFGLGRYGQLGHASFNNECLPKRVIELMGSVVTQITCGRQHTMTYVSGRARIYSFGLCGNGQLGTGSTEKSHNPVIVKCSFMPPPTTSQDNSMETDELLHRVRSIHGGGDQSYCITALNNTQKPLDFRDLNEKTQIQLFTREMAVNIHSLNTNDSLPPDLADKIELVFGCLGCLNASFLTQDDSHFGCNKDNPGVDLDLATKSFDLLSESRNKAALRLLTSRLEEKLLPSMVHTPPPDVETLRIYMTLPLCHLFTNKHHYQTIVSVYAESVLNLNEAASTILNIWWSRLKAAYLINLVLIFKTCVLETLKSSIPCPMSQNEVISRRQQIYFCMEILKKLNDVNELCNHKVPCAKFYIEDIAEIVDIRWDYRTWLQDKRPSNGGLSFCDYPFVFNGAAKSVLLQTDAHIQMQMAVDTVAQHNVMAMLGVPMNLNAMNPCLVLAVSRDNIVHDTLAELAKHGGTDLKKPLKVFFKGEEAMDAGGVKKEFFLLLIREILDPKYGMFSYNDESRLLWFTHQTFEDKRMFNLIGILCGLAIYNDTIIDLHFPLALFKQMLSWPVLLEDLKELKPSVGRGLQSLLDYKKNDVEDTFNLNFTVTEEIFGEVTTVDLLDTGSTMTVTQDNKAQYVQLYVGYVLSKSVSDEFEAFNQGFHQVVGSRVLQLFKPLELQEMVVGNEEYDWSQFQQNAQYKEGYNKDHPTIKLFWTVFHDLSLEDKKKFLLFLTGSDRIPIYGMKAVPIIIQSVRGGDNYYPVAHTCFNLIDLPQYKHIETLREKLLVSIQHTQGFTLV